MLSLPTTVYFFLPWQLTSRTKHGIRTVPVSPESHLYCLFIHQWFIFSFVIFSFRKVQISHSFRSISFRFISFRSISFRKIDLVRAQIRMFKKYRRHFANLLDTLPFESWPYFRLKHAILHTRFQTWHICLQRPKLCHHRLGENANDRFVKIQL